MARPQKPNLGRKFLFIAYNTECNDKSMLNWIEMALNGVIVLDAVSVMWLSSSFPWHVNLSLGVIPLWLTALKDYLLSKKWLNKSVRT